MMKGELLASDIQSGIKLANWLGASTRGDSGVQVVEGWIARTVFEIPAIPDFSSPRFSNLASLEQVQRVSAVAANQAQLLSALHQLGPSFGISLRYCISAPSKGARRIRVFLVGRAFGASEIEAVRGAERFTQVFHAAFPREYPLSLAPHPSVDTVLNEALNLSSIASLVEIIKPERALKPWHVPELCGFSHYYLVDRFHPANNTRALTCAALLKERADTSVVDITLIPAPPMTHTEMEEVKNWTTICEHWSREQRREIAGGLYSEAKKIEIEPDPMARDVGAAYSDLIQTYGANERLFLYSVRILSSNLEPPTALATAIAAEALSPGTGYYLRDIPKLDNAYLRALTATRNCSLSPAVYNGTIWQRNDAQETLRRLHRLVGVDEIAGFFRFPIVGKEGCPGMPLDSGMAIEPRPDAKDAPEITIGQIVEDNTIGREEANVTLKELPKSALIVGMPGSGKTTLCFTVLSQLWRDHRIPFMVLEPAKSEYRALLTLPEFANDMWVFTAGNEHICPFRLNPFEVPEGVVVSEHISALMTCFAGAFDLWEPLPVILERAIRNAYRTNGWSEYEAGGDRLELEPPTMDSVYRHAVDVASQASYQGEVAGNIKGAIETRLGSLLMGPKGRCFNSRRSIPLQQLLARPVVLELDALNEEEKALLMMFVLTFIRAHAKQTRPSGSPLAHVLLVEEAHVVIGRADANQGSQGGNAKSVAIRMFTRALAEMRALGEGIVIADQLPTAIAPEAIKNTNLKVMHRLVSADDRSELGQAMILDAGQIEQAATLLPGRALVHKEGWPKARLVAERDFKALFQVEEPPLDRDLKEMMAPVREQEGLRVAYLPYPGCAQVCRTCSVRMREEIERACMETIDEEHRTGDLRDYSATVLKFRRAANMPDNDTPESEHEAGRTTDDEILRRGCFQVFYSDVFQPIRNFHLSRSGT